MSEVSLQEGERVLARFRADRGTYIREHVILALLGAVLMSAVLMAIDNPYPWTGVAGSFIAIAIRGFYAASEQLAMVWTLTDRRLIGPGERDIPLAEIKTVNALFSAAQVVTRRGDKYLLKYLPDARGTARKIMAASGIPAPEDM